MPADIAGAIVLLALAYAAIGLILALAFVTVGVGKVDHAAAGAPWSFRLLILPGAAVLWPVIARKWLRARRSREAHE